MTPVDIVFLALVGFVVVLALSIGVGSLMAAGADESRVTHYRDRDGYFVLEPITHETLKGARHAHAGRDHRTARRYHRIDGPRRRTAHPGE